MRVLIIGASGLVGGQIFHYLCAQGWEVVGTHLSYPTDYTQFYDTLGQTVADNTAAAFLEPAPDVIVHCGALTHVDYCETHQAESYTKTVESTLHLITLAQQHNARLVYISSDYVFDGTDGPYRETAIPRPLNVYGQHKLAAEQAVAASGLAHLIVRITNVYGDELRRKNFVCRLIDSTLRDSHLRLPVDQYATPVNAADVARVIYLLLRDDREGLYHVGSTDYCNRYQLAARVIGAIPNSTTTLKPVTTDQLNQPALRPLHGGLLSSRFVSEYPDFLFTNVDDYLKSKLT